MEWFGRFTNKYYDNLSSTSDVWGEIAEQFDTPGNFILTAIDISSVIHDGDKVCGVGSSGMIRIFRPHTTVEGKTVEGQEGITTWVESADGWALIPASGNCFEFDTAAHELGHAFGLAHDFRGGSYIMSYEPIRDRLSKCAAEFLDVHPVFNSRLLNKNRLILTEIKMSFPGLTFTVSVGSIHGC